MQAVHVLPEPVSVTKGRSRMYIYVSLIPSPSFPAVIVHHGGRAFVIQCKMNAGAGSTGNEASFRFHSCACEPDHLGDDVSVACNHDDYSLWFTVTKER